MDDNEMVVGEFDEDDGTRYFCPICGTVYEAKELGDNLLFCPKCSILNRLIQFNLQDAVDDAGKPSRWAEGVKLRQHQAESITPMRKKRVVIDDDAKQEQSLDIDSITYELYTKQHTRNGVLYGVMDLAEPDNNEDDVLEF